MQREHAFHTFAVTDPAHAECLVQAVSATPDDDARENLDAFLVAFDDLGMHLHRVADREFRFALAILFRFNFFL